MIVVDASVAVAAIVESGARGVAAQQRLDGAETAAPELIDVEVGSALRGRVLSRRLSPEAAGRGLAAFGHWPLDRYPHRPLLPRAWELRDNLTLYDAVYVALAELLGAPLVTFDGGIARASGLRCAVELIR